MSGTLEDIYNDIRNSDTLGTSHIQRFECLGELGDLDKAIHYRSLAVKLTPDGDPDLSLRISNLVSSYEQRFTRLGELGDLAQLIQHQSRVVKLTPDGHPDLPMQLANLGAAHTHRFERLGELADLENAIRYESRAFDLTPKGHPHFLTMLANLGISHKCRFQALGEPADLEKAIQFQSRAVKLTSDGHPDLPLLLANLGGAHTHRFERLGELVDLEKAFQYHSRAVNLIRDGHPLLPPALINLGNTLNNRFQHLGELGDLDKAIQHQSRAVELTTDRHPHLPRLLTNLGNSHKYRFEFLGELGDLEKSIQHQSRVVKLTPDGHPDLPLRLANLGGAHTHRFERLGELVDLEEAFQYQHLAIKLTPHSDRHLPAQLANLGTIHSYRFQHLGELSDLDKAIDHHSRAVELTPDGHPDLPLRIHGLGTSYENRFNCSGELSDLEKVIQQYSRASTLIPEGHPSLSLLHFYSARSNFIYSQRKDSLPHLQNSLRLFRIAAHSHGSPPRDRFKHARQWATLASKHSSLKPIEAYQATINLLPQFIWLGATTNQRYEDLQMAKTLAVDAACAAVLSQNYALAVEWLEHARCVVWNQNAVLRSPVAQLQSLHPALANKFQTVKTELYNASSESREARAVASGLMTAEQVAQRHRQLVQDYNDLISEARALPGFKDFLQPIRSDRLVHTARHGPVVVINCHRDCCDALLILPEVDIIEHILLPDMNDHIARDLQSRLRMSLGNIRRGRYGIERRPWIDTVQDFDFRTVLAVLWYCVVKPVLDFLGYTSDAQSSSLPHITWCPTGALTFLPLHAAGDYDQPRSRVFNYAVSSYTPTLTGLLGCTPSSLSPESGVLAIGQQATPGHTKLPCTIKELASVTAHTDNQVRYSQLLDAQATTAAVLDAMEWHHWVHFACHAHQSVGNALGSGFFLHDGTLDLEAINQRLFRNKGLAFLSACQTAQGDEKLPDEAVHLASGMMMAGYTSVIATMWSVVDADAPVVADEVYARLLPDGNLGNGEAGRALHEAVAVLREEVGEDQFERWVPYIHIGA